MEALVHTQTFKNSQFISPGIVGSVGDALLTERLKQSTPNQPSRYSGVFGPNSSRIGSNVQDGYSYSHSTGGGGATTMDSRWVRNSFKTQYGWKFQDRREPDKTLEPIMGSTGSYNWLNRIANVYQAKVTGEMFLPLPGKYGPGNDVTRGSQVPRIVAVDKPTFINLEDDSFYDRRANTAIGNAPGTKRAVVCTKPNGQRTYRAL
jgi:hypothetical protein